MAIFSSDSLPRHMFRRLVLLNLCLICLSRFYVMCIFAYVTMSTFNCGPCACTSQEVWKRDVEARFNQTFGLTCFAIAVKGKMDKFQDGPIFYADNSCTRNCSAPYNLERFPNIMSLKERRVVWMTELFVWCGTFVIYLTFGALGLYEKSLTSLKILLAYLALDASGAMFILFFREGPITGNIFETLYRIAFKTPEHFFMLDLNYTAFQLLLMGSVGKLYREQRLEQRRGEMLADSWQEKLV